MKESDFQLLLVRVVPILLLAALSVAEIIVLKRTKWIGSRRAVILPLVNLILSIIIGPVLIVLTVLFELLILVGIGVLSGVRFNVNYPPWVYIAVPGDVLVTFAVCFCGFFLLRTLTRLLVAKSSSLTWKYDLVFALIAGTITMILSFVPLLLRLFEGSPPYEMRL